MTDQGISLFRYVMVYSVAQIIAMAIPIALLLVDVDLGDSANIIGAFLSACVTAYVFVKWRGRAPTKAERYRLAWLSLAAAWTISLIALSILVVVAGPALVDSLKKQLGGLAYYWYIGIVAFVSTLFLAIYHISYGWYAGIVARAVAKRRGAL
jgi:hypothetical protein